MEGYTSNKVAKLHIPASPDDENVFIALRRINAAVINPTPDKILLKHIVFCHFLSVWTCSNLLMYDSMDILIYFFGATAGNKMS